MSKNRVGFYREILLALSAAIPLSAREFINFIMFAMRAIFAFGKSHSREMFATNILVMEITHEFIQRFEFKFSVHSGSRLPHKGDFVNLNGYFDFVANQPFVTILMKWRKKWIYKIINLIHNSDMKLEVTIKVDTDSDSEECISKAHAEASQAALMLEFALKHRKKSNSAPTGSFQMATVVRPRGLIDLDVRPEYRPIMDIISALPKEFTTSDVIVGLGENGKRDRVLAKSAIADAINRNVLDVLEAGKGRRPSRYIKLTSS